MAVTHHEVLKMNQNHRASIVARMTKDRARDLGRRTYSKNSPHVPPPAIHKWRPHVAPAPHMGKLIWAAHCASRRRVSFWSPNPAYICEARKSRYRASQDMRNSGVFGCVAK